jgi:acyl carrier protein
MDLTEFLLTIDELLELEPGTLKGTEKLDELEGWNSLAVIGFMAVVSERFGIVVPPKKISACSTVGDLIALTEIPK